MLLYFFFPISSRSKFFHPISSSFFLILFILFQLSFSILFHIYFDFISTRLFSSHHISFRLNSFISSQSILSCFRLYRIYQTLPIFLDLNLILSGHLISHLTFFYFKVGQLISFYHIVNCRILSFCIYSS